MTEQAVIEGATTLEEQRDQARARLLTMQSKREEVFAALETAEERRRIAAQGEFTNDPCSPKLKTKSLQAATRERDDAQRLFDDIELIVNEAQVALNLIAEAINERDIRASFDSFVALGMERAALLEGMAADMKSLSEKYQSFRELGRKAKQQIMQALKIPAPANLFDQIRYAAERLKGPTLDTDVAAQLVLQYSPVEIRLSIENMPRGMAERDLAECERRTSESFRLK